MVWTRQFHLIKVTRKGSRKRGLREGRGMKGERVMQEEGRKEQEAEGKEGKEK